MNRTQWLAATVVGCAGLAVASPAFAHIDPDPIDAQAGSEVSVGFTVQHGCDGSPTVKLDMRLPDGVTEGSPEPPEGWTGIINGNVVTFEGGPLADDTELTLGIRMVLPPTPDTTIYFPFVQRCATGEIRWIDIPSNGSGTELDEPAPAMRLFGPVAAPSETGSTTPSPTQPAGTVAPPVITQDPITTSSEVPQELEDDTPNSVSGLALVVGPIVGAVGLTSTVVLLHRRRVRR